MRTVRIATSAALLLAIVASAQTTTNPPFTIKILLAGVTTNGGDGSAIAFQADGIGRPVDAFINITHTGVLATPSSTTFMGVATITAIDLSGSGDFSLIGQPDPSQTFPVNQNFTFDVKYKPSTSLRVTGALKISYSEQLPNVNGIAPKPIIGSITFNLSGVAPEFTFAYQPPPNGNTTPLNPNDTIVFPL